MANAALDVQGIIEEAFERINLDVQSLTAGHFETARRSLNLVLAAWSMRHWTSWAIDQYAITALPGVITYAMPDGTIGLLTEPFLAISPGEGAPLGSTTIPDWQALPSLDLVSRQRPYASLLDRRFEPCRLTVWPPPDKSYLIQGWRIRRLLDAVGPEDAIDIPTLWINALVCDLALALFFKMPVAMRDAGLREDLKSEQAMAARMVAFDNAEPQSWHPVTSRYSR